MHRYSGWILILVSGVLTTASPFASAQDRSQLPALARSFAPQYKAVGPQEVEAARDRLQTAIHHLQTWLDATNPSHAQAWRDYLAWDKLTMESLRPEGPDPAELQDLVKRFVGTKKYTENQKISHIAYLERPEFVTVREALQNLRRVAVAAAEADANKAYSDNVEKLAATLETANVTPSGEANAEVGRLVAWLQRHDQARPLVTAIQRNYLIPNLEIQFSEQLLGSMQENSTIDRTRPVRDQVLGTSVCGTARMVGGSTLDLVRSQRHALGNALVAGNVYTNTVGQNRGVTIYSHGCGPVCATKPIIFTPGNVYSLPATASSNTHTTIDDIQAKHRFVERIAWKRASKQLPEAEAIANSKTAARLREEVDEQAVDMIANMNRELNTGVRYPIIRRGVVPYWEHYSSSDSHLLIHWLTMAAGQVGSSTPAPPLEKQHDIDVRVHESTVVNLGEQILAGVKLTSERMAEIREENEMPPPKRTRQDEENAEQAEEEDEETPWSITFAWEQPVQMKFTPDGFVVYVRATELTRTDNDQTNVIKGDILITAVYKIEVTPQGAILRREGRVEPKIENSGLAPRNIATYHAFLRTRFSTVFPEEIEGRGVVPRGRLSRVGTVHTRYVKTTGDWMTLGMEVSPHAALPGPTIAR